MASLMRMAARPSPVSGPAEHPVYRRMDRSSAGAGQARAPSSDWAEHMPQHREREATSSLKLQGQRS